MCIGISEHQVLGTRDLLWGETLVKCEVSVSIPEKMSEEKSGREIQIKILTVIVIIKLGLKLPKKRKSSKNIKSRE